MITNQQRKRLLRILTERFSQDDLRTLAYIILERPGAYDDLRGETQQAKAVSLLELLEYRNRVGDLIDYIKEFRPDISLSGLDWKIEPPRRVEFVNRVNEILQITNYRAPQYQLVDAPAGYGKTELLQEVAKHYRRRGWLCIYVEMPRGRGSSLEDVVVAIAEMSQCNVSDVQPFTNVKGRVQDIGLEIADCLLKHLIETQHLKRVQTEGIIFLLDNIELLDNSAIKLLLNELVPSVHQGLQRVGIHSPFRTVFAGRYISSYWKELASFVLSSISLTPFSFEVIQDTVKEYTLIQGYPLSSEDIVQIASHLLYLTGGHPRCIAEILNEFSLAWLGETYLLEQESWHSQIVLPVINEIRDMHLCDALDTLSPCRRFTPHLLRSLIERGLIQYDDEYLLEKELTATHLVTRKHGFLQDDITRRLLAIRLRREQPDDFIQMCKAIKEICATYLKKPTTTRPEIVLIELLYQELQLGSYQQMPNTREQRIKLADEFFATLDKLLHTLTAGRDAREMLANLVVALENDWELQFMVNYLLREDTYANHPYKKVKQYIDELYQQCEGD